MGPLSSSKGEIRRDLENERERNLIKGEGKEDNEGQRVR